MKLTKNINKDLFREYDLRGIYGTDITEDVSYTIGRSFGSYISEMGEIKTIVGHDNRNSSNIIINALIKGITDSGIDVINLGLVTTSMYYFGKIKHDLNTGIMVTASHNPKEYNGFKIAFDKKSNAYGQLITNFRDYTYRGNFVSGSGNIQNIDIRDEYLNLLTKSISLGNRKVKVVVDCGNGTASTIIREVLDRFNIEYSLLYCDSDGDFPNHIPDPCVHENQKDLSKKVIELGYDLGIGIDGDADRVGIVDEFGNIISADIYMAIIYNNIYDRMKNKKALYDVKCSKTLIDELDKLKIEKVLNRTGNSYAKKMMEEGNFDFGGEYSGHVFFRDKFPGFDDGIYAGLRMIEIISNMKENLSSLTKNFNKYYSTEELKFKVTEENKFGIVEKVKEYAINKGYYTITIDGVRVEFDDSWALVRASNTGPNITARFEAKTNDRLCEIQDEFISQLEKEISNNK